MALDLVIRGGTVATAEKTFRADVGIQGEKVAAVGDGLSAKRTIEHQMRITFPMLLMSTSEFGNWTQYLPRNGGFM